MPRLSVYSPGRLQSSLEAVGEQAGEIYFDWMEEGFRMRTDDITATFKASYFDYFECVAPTSIRLSGTSCRFLADAWGRAEVLTMFTTTSDDRLHYIFQSHDLRAARNGSLTNTASGGA